MTHIRLRDGLEFCFNCGEPQRFNNKCGGKDKAGTLGMQSNLNLKKAAKEWDLSCLKYQISNHSRIEVKYSQILSERITNIYLGKRK